MSNNVKPTRKVFWREYFESGSNVRLYIAALTLGALLISPILILDAVNPRSESPSDVKDLANSPFSDAISAVTAVLWLFSIIAIFWVIYDPQRLRRVWARRGVISKTAGIARDWFEAYWGYVVLSICLLCYYERHSKLRYSIQYHVPYSQVSIDPEPHDCEWRKAPLGEKYCHYEIQVHTVRTIFTANGEPIEFYDEKATASDQRPLRQDEFMPETRRVHITWRKISD